MEATPRFELGVKVLQTSALPLGYVAILIQLNLQFSLIRELQQIGGVEGFEPSHDGIRIRCLTAWRYPYGLNIKIWGGW